MTAVFKCPTPDCKGDARYSAPGRGHLEGCIYPRNVQGVPVQLETPEPEPKRYKIWEKDDFFQFYDGPRMDMDPVAVKVVAERLPIIWQYDLMDEYPLGWAYDIRLEDDELTCSAQWTMPERMDDEMMETFRCRLGGYYRDVIKVPVDPENPKGDQIIQACSLSAVSVVFLDRVPGFNPGAKTS